MRNDTKINCPECDSLISLNAKKCKCGWKILGSNNSLIAYHCCFVEEGKQCNSPNQLLRISLHHEAPKFLCLFHYEKIQRPHWERQAKEIIALNEIKRQKKLEKMNRR